ncbi:cytochrome C assembly family protein [Catenovulum sediminis]|uniref:cytochrome C assembly family protein n=1 Tax=Catenovulum sediminis TaxID=1740262 RepID=UPI00117C6243|nr:cytochrome c biogenesis protein CcsA [Catenovulum sediminis]
MILAVLAVLSYITSATGLFMRLFNKLENVTNLLISIGILGTALHISYIFMHFQVSDEHAYSLLLAANVVVVTVNILTLFFSIFSGNVFALPVNLIFAATICALSMVIPAEVTNFASWTLETLSHISLALLSYGVLVIATLLTYQYNFVASRLKHHDLSVLSLPMPALNSIENQIITLLKVGSGLLTLSIVSGFIFLENFIGSGQAHKTILSLFAWIMFIGVIIGHHKFGWRGRITLVITTCGSLLLTIGYFGSRLMREIILN